MASDVSIRLSVQDGEIVRNALKNIGRDGEAAWGRIEASAVRASAVTQRAGKAVNDNAANYRRFGAVAQQAGYQVGDFAVQVASGGNPLVALTQQASQFLGVMGPWGAVIGAAAAIAGGLAIAFWDTESASKDAEQAIKDYEKAIESAENFIKRLNDETKTSAELLRDERAEILANTRARVDAAQAQLDILLAQAEAVNKFQQDPNADPMFGSFVDYAAINDQVAALQEVQAEYDRLTQRIDEALQKNLEYKEAEESNKAREKAASEAERQAEKIQGVIDGLEYEIDALSMSERQQAINNSLRQAGADVTDQQAESIRNLAGELYDYEQRLDDLNDALDREQKTMEDGERVREANRTALEKYNDELERLNELLRAGAIDQETYGRAAKKAQEDLEKSQEKASEAGRDFGRVVTGGLEDIAVGAKTTGDAFEDLGEQIGRIILRMTILKDLEKSIGDIWDSVDFGGSGGGITGAGSGSSGGIFGAIGSGISSLFGFADGGVMTGSGPVPLRAYSNGGVASSPQLALFGEGRRPEAYVPLPDGRNIPVKMEGGGEPFTYSPMITIDARNSTLSAAEIRSIVKTAVDGSVAEVRSLQRRKGNARI
ncbi:hypothetical protein [Thalassospira sp.]|uniref:hypothetical protein n=1 Tax=Thalassospira sp. TaxID=1912094 RepID=UPI000C5A647F|nr:hypothetical protein [Thalassospira sp.]MBC05724.1 hypothetical protein [Thalassospira sp.]|tara:strand:- start:1855 stop:3660 length:1806 start_codon:yes stop_codon:yes gene_type:complete